VVIVHDSETIVNENGIITIGVGYSRASIRKARDKWDRLAAMDVYQFGD
jgi:hypothetical protein